MIELIIKNANFKISQPLNLIVDLDVIMREKNKLKLTYFKMVVIGIAMGIIEISAIFYGFVYKNWNPFAVGIAIVVVLAIYLLKIYYSETIYICSNCNKKFKPNFKEFIFANHTLKTRKLTCTHCGVKEFSIETVNDWKL